MKANKWLQTFTNTGFTNPPFLFLSMMIIGGILVVGGMFLSFALPYYNLISWNNFEIYIGDFKIETEFIGIFCMIIGMSLVIKEYRKTPINSITIK